MKSISKVKIDREAVYKKYDGHCAYCVDRLPFKDMNVDHIIAKAKYKKLPKEKKIKIELNGINNLNPSCHMCNYYKHTFTIESFRKEIKTLHTRFTKIFIVRLAIKYGMLKILPWNELFFFEKYNKLRRTK
jgi:5-methylcytosine-specific restriction endonuclease McrA